MIYRDSDRPPQAGSDLIGPKSNLADWRGFWGAVLVTVVTAALCLPFIQSVFWLGDEGILLHGADRMLRGDTLYTDFFEFLPPGSFVVTAAWLSIAGGAMWSARLFAILAITGIACFTYLACWRASKHFLASAVIVIGWVIVSQGFWTQLSHHWLTTLFSMVTAWAVLNGAEDPKNRMRYLAIAGLAAGAAGMVTPTRGAFAVLAGMTAFGDLRRNIRQVFIYAIAVAVVPICLIAYVFYKGAFAAAFDDIILFAAQRYASIQGVPFGHAADVQTFPVLFMFPVAALLALVIFVLDWRATLQDRKFRICLAFGLAGFAGCFPRPDVAHIGFAAPLVCPLLVYCISRLTQSWQPKYYYAVGLVVIGLGVPSARAHWWSIDEALHTKRVETPRGAVAIAKTQRGLAELIARMAATPSKDGYFFYPYMPMLPFLTMRAQTAKYDIYTPNYTSPAQYEESCLSAVRHATWVVIDRKWTDPDFLRDIFPAMRDPAPPELRKFERALDMSFSLVARMDSFEIRRRLDTANESVCAGIGEE